MRVFQIIFGVIILGAMGVMAFLPVLFERAVTDVSDTVTKGEELGIAGKAALGIASFAANREEKSRANILFSPDQLNRMRSITYSDFVSIEDVLEPGEDTPAAAYHELYINARVQQRAEAECQALFDGFATRCLPSVIKVDPLENGRFEIDYRLQYAPAYAIGEVREKEGVQPRLDTRSHSLTSIPFADVSPDEFALARKAHFEMALGDCERLRKETGNCVIESLRFRTKENSDGSGTYRMTSNVKLATMTTGSRASFTTKDLVDAAIQATN